MVFGTDAGIETSLSATMLETNVIQTVVGSDRTDIAGAIRLGTAAFPEAVKNGSCSSRTATKTSATPCRR